MLLEIYITEYSYWTLKMIENSLEFFGTPSNEWNQLLIMLQMLWIIQAPNTVANQSSLQRSCRHEKARSISQTCRRWSTQNWSVEYIWQLLAINHFISSRNMSLKLLFHSPTHTNSSRNQLWMLHDKYVMICCYVLFLLSIENHGIPQTSYCGNKKRENFIRFKGWYR